MQKAVILASKENGLAPLSRVLTERGIETTVLMREDVNSLNLLADAAEKAQEENGFCEYVILRAEKDENGEDSLVTIDDDEEFDDVADYFDDLFSEEIDYDAKN